MILALAGNQNCGKTTLFNQLTGSNQHVGNFPGVTVEQKSGQVRGQKNCTVVDLPGIYSLRPYTAEEIVTRDYILRQKPDGIINIVDATNLERNLYLTLQLLTLRVPMVLALNMMDELTGNGGSIDVKKMAQTLGIPVVPICAAALISGFIAKESVVSTLEILLGTSALGALFTTKSAVSFLVFTRLYTPCVAAIAAIRREVGSGFRAGVIALCQCCVAYLAAFAVFSLLRL